MKKNTRWLIATITFVPLACLGFWLGVKLFERVKW